MIRNPSCLISCSHSPPEGRRGRRAPPPRIKVAISISTIATATSSASMPLFAQSGSKLAGAFGRFGRHGVQAVIVPVNGLFFSEGRQIAQLALAARLPTVGAERRYIEAGVDCTSGSGGPPGKQNGQYRHGDRTKAAIAEQRKFSALLKMLRAGLS
jgi:hypothetical protein